MIVERIGRVKYNIKNSERQSLLGNHFKTPINPPPLGVIHNWDSFKIGIRAGFETKIIFGIWISNIKPHREGASIGRPSFLTNENYFH